MFVNILFTQSQGREIYILFDIYIVLKPIKLR